MCGLSVAVEREVSVQARVWACSRELGSAELRPNYHTTCAEEVVHSV